MPEGKGMRRILVAAAAALSIAGASSFVTSRAEAMPLPGAAGLAAAADSGLVQDVRTVCRPVWNGWRWVQQCYWVPGHRHHWHHRHHHHRHHHHHRRHHFY
jgi:hypothetical protein